MRANPCPCVREWMSHNEDVVSEGDFASSSRNVMKSELANKLNFGSLITNIRSNINTISKGSHTSDGPRGCDQTLKVKSSHLFYNCSEDQCDEKPVNILQNIYESILHSNKNKPMELKPQKFVFPIKCTCHQKRADDYLGKSPQHSENMCGTQLHRSDTKSSCKTTSKSVVSEASCEGPLYDCNNGPFVSTRSCPAINESLSSQARKTPSEPSCSSRTQNKSVCQSKVSNTDSKCNSVGREGISKRRCKKENDVVVCSCQSCKEDQENKTNKKSLYHISSLNNSFNKGSDKSMAGKKTVTCESCNREICVTKEECGSCQPKPKQEEKKVQQYQKPLCESCNYDICVTKEFCGECGPCTPEIQPTNYGNKNIRSGESVRMNAIALEKKVSIRGLLKKESNLDKKSVFCDSCTRNNFVSKESSIDKTINLCESCIREISVPKATCGECGRSLKNIHEKNMNQKTSSTCNNMMSKAKRVQSRSETSVKPERTCFCKNKDSLLDKIKRLIQEHMPECNCPLHAKDKQNDNLQNFHSHSNLQTKNYEQVEGTRCCKSNNSLEDPCRFRVCDSKSVSGGNLTSHTIKSPNASYLLLSYNQQFDNLIKNIADSFPECTCSPAHSCCQQSTIENIFCIKETKSQSHVMKNKSSRNLKKVSQSKISEILNNEDIGLMEIKEITLTTIMVKYEIPKYEGIKGYKSAKHEILDKLVLFIITEIHKRLMNRLNTF